MNAGIEHRILGTSVRRLNKTPVSQFIAKKVPFASSVVEIGESAQVGTNEVRFRRIRDRHAFCGGARKLENRSGIRFRGDIVVDRTVRDGGGGSGWLGGEVRADVLCAAFVLVWVEN